jgi:precorrin-6B methylase 2
MIVRTCLVAILVLFWANAAVAESTPERVARLLSGNLNVGEGAVVADIGAGSGKYSIAMSKLVGTRGTVYATELEEDDRNDIAEAADEAGASNVQVMKAEFESTGLPAASCDGVYLRRVYHHVVAPEPFNRSLLETVRPGGRLVIVDFRPTWYLALFVPEGIPENRGGHGIQPGLVVEELEAAGFTHVETIDVWDPDGWFQRDFAVVFERPDSGA